jgi:FkbM family methyltransferase
MKARIEVDHHAATQGPSALWFYRSLMALRPAWCGVLFKRLLGITRRVVVCERGTFYLDPCSRFGLTLLRNGCYEEELTGTFEARLHEGSVCVDVGANEGYFSIVASKLVGAQGRVIAVEPQTRLRPVLERNFSLNQAANIQLHPVAVSNVSGKVDIYLAPDTITGSTSLSKSRKYPVPRETVNALTVQELLDQNRVRTVDLMKMDIESHEYEAILGSSEVFRSKRIRCLALELHPFMLKQRGKNPEEITEFLRGAGYEIVSFAKFVLATL